jgi:HSP20 family protein
MPPKDPINWMLSDAIETLARAERLHQQFLNLRPWAGTQEPSWEPPIDVLETDHEVLILIALPGVDPNEVDAVIDQQGTLVVSGRRILPAELRNARILRLELPQGRFERRIALPTGRYTITRFSTNGCVGLRLAKSN